MIRAPIILNIAQRKDALELLRTLPRACTPLVFFDPQHRGVLDHLKFGNEGARQRGRSELPAMTDEYIDACCHEISRVVTPSGYLMLWADTYRLCEGHHLRIADALKPVDLIAWDSLRIGMGKRTRRRGDYLLVLQKPPVVARTWKDHKIPSRWAEKVDRAVHPHVKPIGLIERLIAAVTTAGDLIVDPAAGSFAVMHAAHQLGRNFTGGDLIDPMPAMTRRASAGPYNESRRGATNTVAAKNAHPQKSAVPKVLSQSRLAKRGVSAKCPRWRVIFCDFSAHHDCVGLEPIKRGGILTRERREPPPEQNRDFDTRAEAEAFARRLREDIPVDDLYLLIEPLSEARVVPLPGSSPLQQRGERPPAPASWERRCDEPYNDEENRRAWDMIPTVPFWGSCMLEIGRAAGLTFRLEGKRLHIDGFDLLPPEIRPAFEFWCYIASKSIAARLEKEVWKQ